MYFSAGWVEHGHPPYIITKLFEHIMRKLPSKKRIVLMNDINQNPYNFQHNDTQANYQEQIEVKVEESFWDIVRDTLKSFGKSALDLVNEHRKEILAGLVTLASAYFKENSTKKGK